MPRAEPALSLTEFAFAVTASLFCQRRQLMRVCRSLPQPPLLARLLRCPSLGGRGWCQPCTGKAVATSICDRKRQESETSIIVVFCAGDPVLRGPAH